MRTMSVSVRILKFRFFFTAKLLKMDLRTSGREKTPMILVLGQRKTDNLVLNNTYPVKSLMALIRKDIKLEMRMISSLA